MRQIIVQLIVSLLLIVFFLAGQLGWFTSMGMEPPAAVALAILLIAATLWITEAIPLFVTSFIILLLCTVWLLPELELQGIAATSSDFSSPFFSNIILLFLGGFVIASAMHKHRLDEQAARWVIRKTGNSIPKLIAGLMVITAVLSMFLSNTATTAMMITLCLPIIQGLPRGDNYRKAIILCIPFAANIGGLGTPIGTPPNAIGIQYMEQLGSAPSFAMWMLMAMPLVVVMLILIWAGLLLIFKGEIKTITPPPEPKVRDRMTVDRIVILAIAGLTVFGWLTSKLHGHGIGTVALIPVIVFFGLKILNIKDLRALAWDVLMIMAGGLCLGVAMGKSGLAEWVIAQLPSDGLSLVALMIILGCVACLMSSLMSNTATANLMMPIVIGLQISGVSSLLMTVAFCCSVAMVLPISTPPNAIAFSSGEIAVKDMLKAGLLFTIIGVVLTFTLGMWWWKTIGVF